MLIIYIFFLHFIADFVLQPREMAKNKSSDMTWLFGHIVIQVLTFWIGLYPFIGFLFAGVFAIVNGIIHAFIDGFIWKGYGLLVWLRNRKSGFNVQQLKQNRRFWEDHWFYVFIGLDQFLHVATLVLLIIIAVGGL